MVAKGNVIACKRFLIIFSGQGWATHSCTVSRCSCSINGIISLACFPHNLRMHFTNVYGGDSWRKRGTYLKNLLCYILNGFIHLHWILKLRSHDGTKERRREIYFDLLFMDRRWKECIQWCFEFTKSAEHFGHLSLIIIIIVIPQKCSLQWKWSWFNLVKNVLAL